MKNVKKHLTAALLACSSLFCISSANAVPITTSFYNGDALFAEFEFYLDNSLVESGLGPVSTYDDMGFDLVSAYFPLLVSPVDLWEFEAIIDVDNIMAGVEYLYSDAEDFGWSLQLMWDAFGSPENNFVSIYEIVAGGEIYYEQGSPITVTSVVSEPSMIAFLALAFAGMAYRRRQA